MKLQIEVLELLNLNVNSKFGCISYLDQSSGHLIHALKQAS